jgi:hypothetical protein
MRILNVPSTSPSRATPVFLGLLFTLLFGVQLVLYRDSFHVKPSSDDFIALHQIDRGQTEGAGTFFRASDVTDYRPLQNLTFWLFGRMSRGHVLAGLRWLHVLSFMFYAAVAFLWFHALGFHRVGAVLAACVLFLHPTQAGPLAGLDNYSRFVVSAWVWLGAWIAYTRGARPRIAIPFVCLCFAIALGYMEYAVGLVPLAFLATARPGDGRRWREAWITAAALLAILAVYVLIRVSGVVTTTSGASALSLDPRTWAWNAAMMVTAVLFFGNTVPIMRDTSPAGFAWLCSNAAIVALAILYGLRAWRDRPLAHAGGAHPMGFPAAPGLTRSLDFFLCAAFATALFPMILMRHVSEIYLTGVTLALALLTGLSVRGWLSASRPLQFLALILAGLQLLLAAGAIRGKVAGVLDAGERTEALFRQILEHLPGDGTTRRVATVFLEREHAAAKSYSIFAMPDDELIPTGFGTHAIRWFRPGQDIRLDHVLVADPSLVDLGPYDLVLLWDHSTGRFSLLKPRAA